MHYSVGCLLLLMFEGQCLLCIGVTGCTKACMAENSTNDNQALGVAVLALSWGIGIVIGPAISAVTADPIGQYNLNITSKQTVSIVSCYLLILTHEFKVKVTG